MYRCILCAFDTELDDVVVANPHGRCVCLRCFLRETGSAKRMEKRLHRELSAMLNQAA